VSNFKLTLGLVILAIICLLALAGPAIIQVMFPGEKPLSFGAYKPFDQPSPEHPLGTDQMGRDAVAALLSGLRMSLIIGLVAGLMSVTLGVLVGFAAGFIGGTTSSVLRIVADMFLVFPTLPLLLILALYIPKWNVVTMGLLLGAFGWAYGALTVRAQVLSLRERAYVDLARLNDESTLEIIFTELMPGLLPYIFLSMSGAMVGAILAEAGLQVIGIGAGLPPTVGYMLGHGFSSGVIGAGLYGQMLVPAAVLILLFLGLNLVNMGLEERFNPRLRTVAEER
jgi:peptide/nickel transport system permease protein